MTQAKFVQGSIFRHILVMSSTNAIGLTALFLVDLVDLFFISLLGEIELAAAVGYAGTLSFFTTSVSIGIAITMTALVSKSLGQRDKERAQRYVINILVFGFIVTASFSALVWWFTPELLSMLGAKGRTLDLASDYLRIILPSLPILAVAMSGGAVLRSVGDAKYAMKSTLSGGAVNACLDPIFIFALGLGIHGAAIASVIARLAIMIISMRGVIIKHQLITRFNFSLFWPDLAAIVGVAIPAMMTNIATPIGNAYVTFKIAQYGDGVMAGWAIVGRIIPVAFGMIFAISGAIGPIIGQNYGAHDYLRVKQTLKKSLLFSTAYVFLMSIILMLSQSLIIHVFDAGDEAAEIISLFSNLIALSFIFNGAMFIGNAALNNLGHASYSTLLNFGKASLGTFPFVYFGSLYYGAPGVLYGQALGSVLFGIISLVVSYHLVNRIHQRYLLSLETSQSDIVEIESEEEEGPLQSDIPFMPYSSGRAFICPDGQLSEDGTCGDEKIEKDKTKDR